MISNQEKLETMQKVLSGEEFSHSLKNQELLKYLVESSLDDKELTETIIATEFFDKGSDFNPLEDASIRVSISQIRKRLLNYYLTQGQKDKILIDIPKGHYVVRFFTRSERAADLNLSRSVKLVFSITTICLLIIITFIWIKYERINKKIEIFPRENPIWAEILEETRPTLVILGDYFFMYMDRNGDNPRFNVRDPRINSLEEYHEYSIKNPDSKENLKPLAHSYLRPSAVWGFMELLPILKSMKSSFLVKQASEVDWADISSNNVIFIGTFKQMYILKTFLDKLHVKFSIYPNHLYLYNKNGEEVQKFVSKIISATRQYNDVSLLAKIQGPNNNTIVFITGFQEGGVINGSKAISDPDFPKKLFKDYDKELQNPFIFRTVLKVEGFRRTELNSNIEYFETLSQ